MYIYAYKHNNAIFGHHILKLNDLNIGLSNYKLYGVKLINRESGTMNTIHKLSSLLQMQRE